MSRALAYSDALGEATILAMERDPRVFLMGVGVDDPGGIFGSTKAPHDRFGDARVFDTPISEAALTGVAVGAAVTGMRPMMVHARCDFLLLTLDQLANHAAKWSYMSGGKLTAPVVVRAIIGRGWGQAAQHSQSLQSVLASFAGMQVIMPATAYDAKGMLLSALTGSQPVVSFEHRWLYGVKGDVPEGWYTVEIGKARVAREGRDVTIAALSHMVLEAQKAAEILAKEGIDAEVIDLRSVHPWDEAAVTASVRKTGRLVLADTGPRSFGVTAEIAATISEKLFGMLKAPVRRVGLPEVPTPCAPVLETAFYPGAPELVRVLRECVAGVAADGADGARKVQEKPFSGAF